MDLQSQGLPLQILAHWTWLSFCLAVLHSHGAQWDAAAQGTEEHLHSREIGCLLPQPPVVEDGGESEQGVKLFDGRNLAKQEHVSVFWLVLAQQRCWGSCHPPPQATLLHAPGSGGCTVCFHCRELYKTPAVCPCLPWPSCWTRKGFFLSFAMVSLIRQLWRLSPSNSVFHYAWLCAEDLLDCDSCQLIWIILHFTSLPKETIQHLCLTPHWFPLSCISSQQKSKVASR